MIPEEQRSVTHPWIMGYILPLKRPGKVSPGGHIYGPRRTRTPRAVQGRVSWLQQRSGLLEHGIGTRIRRTVLPQSGQWIRQA